MTIVIILAFRLNRPVPVSFVIFICESISINIDESIYSLFVFFVANPTPSANY